MENKNGKIGQILKDAENVRVYSEVDGAKVVDYQDATTLAMAESIEGVDFGDRELNPDGSIAKSRVTVLAMNPERRTANRYRVIEEASEGGEPKKLLQVVVDYLAVQQQTTGKVHSAQIPCYELIRDGKKLKLNRLLQVSEGEFVGEFTKTLSVDAMIEVLEAIANGTDEKTGIDEMPI